MRYTAKEMAVVFKMIGIVIDVMLEVGMSVIYDDANLVKEKYRRQLQKIAKHQKSYYQILWFQTPMAVALKRVSERRKPIDAAILFKIKRVTEKPHNEPFIMINGEAAYKKQKEIVLKTLRTR